jgi:hypothetical protein
VTTAAPGPRLYLIVSDIEAAREELISRGADVSKVFHRAAVGGPTVSGVDPERRSYNSFATFKDPDGNEWLLQEITATRTRGRRRDDVRLAAALRRAAAAHGEHEKRTGQHDANWPDWYAEYIAQEQAGGQLPL